MKLWEIKLSLHTEEDLTEQELDDLIDKLYELTIDWEGIIRSQLKPKENDLIYFKET